MDNTNNLQRISLANFLEETGFHYFEEENLLECPGLTISVLENNLLFIRKAATSGAPEMKFGAEMYSFRGERGYLYSISVEEGGL